MSAGDLTLDQFRQLCDDNGVHTVEVAVPDTQAHLRGKRVPVERFFSRVHHEGVNIADAIFVFDMQNDLPENEFVNMDSGYLDCRLVPDISSGRVLTHRPGYALVFADAVTEAGEPHPLAPRGALARQIERCREAGLDPVVATELEFYLCTPDWQPVQDHIQYSSLTDALDLEDVLLDMRRAVAGAGIEVESSNAEYGPGQVEINCGYGPAMRVADDTVLFKSIVKQVARQHGLRATFMPKPWTEHSGSGMHVHTSLWGEGGNLFASCEHRPEGLMAQWVAGQVHHATALTFLGAPTPNGGKRMRPYTFAPCHSCWGLDNRSVMVRCVISPGSKANRAEYRTAGADAHPHLLLAGVLAAGADGIENERELIAIAEGDCYASPGDHQVLPADLAGALDAFEGSELAAMLGEVISRSYASIARAEVDLAVTQGLDADEVSDWERERFMEHC